MVQSRMIMTGLQENRWPFVTLLKFKKAVRVTSKHDWGGDEALEGNTLVKMIALHF